MLVFLFLVWQVTFLLAQVDVSDFTTTAAAAVTADISTDEKKSPRGALILTMAGSGAPSYLQASCLSISAAATSFDMLIFHEDNELIMNMTCAENVKKINVHQHGLARLIATAVCQQQPHHDSEEGPEGSSSSSSSSSSSDIKNNSDAYGSRGSNNKGTDPHDPCPQQLGAVLDTVLLQLPYYLAEFKIGVSTEPPGRPVHLPCLAACSIWLLLCNIMYLADF